MKEYFREDGHLTDEAIEDTINNIPDELARLEISEHLSFCDLCLERYTARVSAGELEAPPETMEETIFALLRRRARLLFFNKYVSVAVAASLTLTLWVTGIFTPSGPKAPERRENKLPQYTATLFEKAETFTERINDAFGNLFSIDFYKGAANHEKK